MAQNEENQDLRRSYLLGVLDEPKQEEIERCLFADEKFCEELQIAEDELIDEYLAEGLTPDERVQFETHFLATPERQQDLNFSRVFRQYVADASIKPASEEKKSPSDSASGDGFSLPGLWKRPAFVYTVVSVCVVALFIGGWLIWSSKYAPVRREQIEQELVQLNEQYRDGQSIAETPAETNRVRLMPGLVRGAGTTNRLQVSPQSNRIEIELEVATENVVAYQATLTSEGAELYSVPNLRATSVSGTNIVRLQLLPKYLPSGDYQIKLHGRTSDGKIKDSEPYHFRVVLQ